MKTHQWIILVLVLVGLTSACGLADDIPRTIPNIADDIPRIVPSIADDIPRTIPNIADDIPRTIPSVADDVGSKIKIPGSLNPEAPTIPDNYILATIDGEASSLLSNLSDSLTPEEKDAIKNVLKSATCIYLKADINGGTIKEEDLNAFIIGMFGIQTTRADQEILEKAEIAFSLIKSFYSKTASYESTYRAAVNIYCG
jgi:hypothetical protein